MTKLILLVEDNPQDEDLIMRALRKVSLINQAAANPDPAISMPELFNLASQLDVVRDGQEALDYLFQEGVHAGRQGRPLPEVVLLDINLPKVNGLDVLARIREDSRTRKLPVVILTSSEEQRDMLRSQQHGADGFVRKPMEFREFSETVAQLGLHWLMKKTSQA